MDLSSVIFSGILGVCFGIITGLIPGIHINLVSLIILNNIIYISSFFNKEEILVFIVSMSITHTFMDFIPSLIFGVPSIDNLLSALPAHKLVLRGKSYSALLLNSVGSLFGVLISIILFPILILTLKKLYFFIENIICYILSLIILLLILIENGFERKFLSVIIVFFSACVGFFVLNSNFINEPLFLIFSGFFGIPFLIISIFNNENSFPEQKKNFQFNLSKKESFAGLCFSSLASVFCSVVPGIGNAQAGVLSSFFLKKKSSELLIFMFGIINSLNFAISFFTLYLINKSRNGSIYVLSEIIQKISYDYVVLYIFTIIIISFFAFFISIILGVIIIKIISKINLKLVNFSIITLLCVMSFYFSGVFGLLILIMCSMLGLFVNLLNLSRYHLMSVLIVPVIFYFL